MNKLKHVATRKYELLVNDLILRGKSKPGNWKKFTLLEGIFVRSGAIFDRWYYGPEVWEMGEKLLERDREAPRFLSKVFENLYEYGEGLKKKTEDIKCKDYSRKTKQELLQDFSDFVSVYTPWGVSPSLWGIQDPIEAKLKSIIGESDSETLGILTFPRKENIVNLEQKELIKIAAEIQKQKLKPSKLTDLQQALQEKIQEHASKYGWINTRGGIGDFWAPQDVFERVKEALNENCAAKLEQIEKARQEHIKQSDELLAKFDDRELTRLVEIARELVYYRTYRTDYLNMCFANTRPLLSALAKSFGVELRDLVNFRIDEILEQKLPSKEELKKRLSNFVIVNVEPGKTLFSSDSAELKQIQEKYFEEEKVNTSQVKGTVAFTGKATGLVKIVLNRSDLTKLKEGDVLVAMMTTPDMIIAMQKASAFVTDEGGITCHAAIVARELKKPCIIGTKIATKVLKDGDIVEVDAVSGVVKKIK